jgi:hypothetical protein
MGGDIRNMRFSLWQHSLRIGTRHDLAHRCTGSPRDGRRRMHFAGISYCQRHNDIAGTAEISCNDGIRVGSGDQYWGTYSPTYLLISVFMLYLVQLAQGGTFSIFWSALRRPPSDRGIRSLLVVPSANFHLGELCSGSTFPCA